VLTVSIVFLRGWRVCVHGSGYARTERKDLIEPFYGGLVPRNALAWSDVANLLVGSKARNRSA